MAKSMFSREVALKLEGEINAFQACRSLSRRARDINTERSKLREAESATSEEEFPNSSASAMLDFAEGRIALAPEEDADSDEI